MIMNDILLLVPSIFKEIIAAFAASRSEKNYVEAMIMCMNNKWVQLRSLLYFIWLACTLISSGQNTQLEST